MFPPRCNVSKLVVETTIGFHPTAAEESVTLREKSA